MQSIQKCGLEHCKVAKYIDIALLRSCRKDWSIEMKNVQISQELFFLLVRYFLIGQEETEPEQKDIVDFQPYVGKKRKPGTGCVTEINDHLFEGRYSPIWPDGTQHSRNVYAHTRDECEEKLKALIAEMDEERKNLKEQLAGIAPPEKLTKKQRKLWDYMRLHPEVTEFSTIAKRTGLARNTVKKHYGMLTAMLGRK